jgi:hypothetical protein
LGVVLLLFWHRQFVTMMGMPDSAFPGRYDKALWFGAFILLSFLAPLAFWAWRLGVRQGEARLAQAAQEEEESDLPEEEPQN